MICSICNKEFNKSGKHRKYCSLECSMIAWKEHISLGMARYYSNHPEKRRYGRYRQIILNTLGNKCSKCDSKDNLHIHEKTYDNTTINDCVVLCRKCHIDNHLFGVI